MKYVVGFTRKYYMLCNNSVTLYTIAVPLGKRAVF
jgi:hypothetical protein